MVFHVKTTSLFNADSDNEANHAIQVATDAQAHLEQMVEETCEMTRLAEAVTAVWDECHWEKQWVAEQQAEKDQLAEVARVK